MHFYQEVLSGERPYKDMREDVTVLLTIIDGGTPSRPQAPEAHGMIDDYMWTLCMQCWNAAPEARPSMKAVLASISGMCHSVTSLCQIYVITIQSFWIM